MPSHSPKEPLRDHSGTQAEPWRVRRAERAESTSAEPPSTHRSRRFEGRFLDGQLVLIYGNVHCSEGGYSVDLRSGELYRNAELVGWVRQLYFDRDVLGWWVEYTSWRGSALDTAPDAERRFEGSRPR